VDPDDFGTEPPVVHDEGRFDIVKLRRTHDRHNFREVVASEPPGDHNFPEVVTIMTVVLSRAG
jgi:hypothetical protein